MSKDPDVLHQTLVVRFEECGRASNFHSALFLSFSLFMSLHLFSVFSICPSLSLYHLLCVFSHSQVSVSLLFSVSHNIDPFICEYLAAVESNMYGGRGESGCLY